MTKAKKATPPQAATAVNHGPTTADVIASKVWEMEPYLHDLRRALSILRHLSECPSVCGKDEFGYVADMARKDFDEIESLWEAAFDAARVLK